MYNKILLPIDGSKNSKQTIKQVVNIIHDNIEVVLLHVIDDVYISHIPEEVLLHPTTDIVNDSSNNLLDKYNEALKKLINNNYENVTITNMSIEGSPSTSIMDVSETINADLIIMSSSNKSKIDKFILGSVTDKTLRNSRVPIMIIPSNNGIK